MSNSKVPTPRSDCVSDSLDTEVVYVDADGDTTVRPIPPERLAQAVAERDLIQKCLAEKNAQKVAGDNS